MTRTCGSFPQVRAQREALRIYVSRLVGPENMTSHSGRVQVQSRVVDAVRESVFWWCGVSSALDPASGSAATLRFLPRATATFGSQSKAPERHYY